MQNNVLTLELPSTTPDRIRSILAAAPRLETATGAEARLLTPTSSLPLVLLEGILPFSHATAPALAEVVGPGQVGLVVAERLQPNVRHELEAAGLSYVDGRGAMHLSGPGVLIHLEPQPRNTKGLVPPPKGLGVVAIRIVQVLLSDHERQWSVNELAALAASSTGQAHNVMARLEDEGLMDSEGRGPSRRRRVRNATDLLDWLARVPAARRFQARLNTYLYAPNPEQLVTRLSHRAQTSGATWALTGATAAQAMGVSTVSALPVAMVRVPAKPGLDAAAALLDLEPVMKGPNVMLIADVGNLGQHGSARIGPVVVAPEVRIWLDMLSEPRGEDAAALFREAVLGY